MVGMKKIGIIGAENSHTIAISKAINVDKRIKGFSVEYLWGETEDFARAAAEAGQIPNIVRTQREMLGKIDALIVDHRHGKYHLKAALPFVKQGIPTFVDKPFCYRGSEGKEFLRIARKNKTPVTSFSSLIFQPSFKHFVKKMKDVGDVIAGISYGSCGLRNKYGGVFFYGIHQMEMALEAFGYDVSSVLVTRNGSNSAAQLIYPLGKIVTMCLIQKGSPGFGLAAIGSNVAYHQAITVGKDSHLYGIRTFTGMFRSGREPRKHEHMLRPVQVLEAMEKSIKSGNREKVEK